MNLVHRRGTIRPSREYDAGSGMPPRAANSGGASHDERFEEHHVTSSQDTRPAWGGDN